MIIGVKKFILIFFFTYYFFKCLIGCNKSFYNMIFKIIIIKIEKYIIYNYTNIKKSSTYIICYVLILIYISYTFNYSTCIIIYEIMILDILIMHDKPFISRLRTTLI